MKLQPKRNFKFKRLKKREEILEPATLTMQENDEPASALWLMPNQRAVADEIARLGQVYVNTSVKGVFGFYAETPNMATGRRVYRRMALQLHPPDRGGMHDKEGATAAFAVLARALELVEADAAWNVYVRTIGDESEYVLGESLSCSQRRRPPPRHCWSSGKPKM